MTQKQTATQYYTPSAQPKSSRPPISPQRTARGLQSVGKVLANAWHAIGTTLRGQFLTQTSFILILALVLAALLSQSFSHATDDLNTVNSESIPSVDAAQAMAQYMEDIDAK